MPVGCVGRARRAYEQYVPATAVDNLTFLDMMEADNPEYVVILGMTSEKVFREYVHNVRKTLHQ